MSQVKVESFTISLDGFGAGPDQSLENPLGAGGEALHAWALKTRTFQRTLFGKEEGSTGPDEDFAARGMRNMGAWILGRNMFSHSRGPWPDDSWKGWWGENPPYHCPVFVLTHHPRPSIEMEGGTVFHFVTGGIHEALQRAREAAGDKDIRIGGGAATIRQYLRARLIDEMHLAIAPVLLGTGEHLFSGIDLTALGYECVEHVGTADVSHVVIRRKPQGGNPAATLSNERLFTASPRQIFQAFENPERLAKWWGPAGFTNTFETFEFRPGGQWKFVMHGPNGADYPNESVFREIQPDTRIVIEHVVRPWYRLTVTLSPRGSQTHLLWEQEFESPEVAERMKPLCKTANEQNLDRLQTVLASGT